ncbi:MAG: hypothetical protein JSS49_25675 [Planctomycetes bacterium]|nr:hypothetical protein [Planctomycetota bacterium]
MSERLAQSGSDDGGATLTPAAAVQRCQTIFAHAWMVRTFVKHSETVEDFPELMQIVRTVFDTARALEPKVTDPADYLATLRKKIGKLRAAADQFRTDAPIASDHTNFRQAVISMDGCVAELEAVIKMFPPPPPQAMPANFRPGVPSGNVVQVSESPPVD